MDVRWNLYSYPKEYYQIYIIYCFSFNKFIPAAYFMMKSKTQNASTLIFTKISKMINNSPKLLIIDFEIAVFNVASYVFKNIEIRGCNFHFNQIIVKFMNINGLRMEYNRNSDFKKYVKYLSILAFIPENKVKIEYKKAKRFK
ncbi:hypothetical protein DMUE_5833 [Dictyocoela muelleri]|nr:hypothetical protein DMUE_5833 [Dictyocoela muelleri]